MKKLILLFISLISIASFSQKEVRCGDAISTSKGTLADTSSSQPRMIITTPTQLAVGANGELSLLMEDESFRMTISLARVIVTAVADDQITFSVLEKLSVIVIDGVERSNFKEGATVQFSEYEYSMPTLVETKWPSGEIKETGYMLCGGKMGEWKEFHENGSKKSSYRTDKNGDIEGRYTEYYDNGAIATDGEYRYGKKTGLWVEYFEDGVVKSQGYYYDGVKTGKWIEHDATGKKVKKKY